MVKEVLRLEHIVTYSSSGKSLDHARLNLFEGEVVGIIGVNNAGKSELAGGIAGTSPFDSGNIYLEEEEVQIHSIEEGREKGIYYFSKHSSLIPEFTIWENFLLGPRGKKLVIHTRTTEEQCREMLELLGIQLDIHEKAGALSLKEKLLVEMAKAIYYDAKIFILDDILHSLSATAQEEFVLLFEMLCSLHVSIILLDNGIRYLKRYCNRLFIMREGRTMAVLNRQEAEDNLIISIMLGTNVEAEEEHYLSDEAMREDVLFEMQDITYQNILSGVSFQIFRGELVGILNVNKNSGRAIKSLIQGKGRCDSGKMLLGAKEVSFASPEEAVKAGVSVLAEQDVVFPNLSLEENIMLPALKSQSGIAGILNRSELKYFSRELMTEYIIGGQGVYVTEQTIEHSRVLRRKISFCRMLSTKPELAVLMNPTQSIDVTSKETLYNDIRSLKNHGITGLIISSDVKELLAVCERILVVNQGKVDASVLNTEKGREQIFHIYGRYLKDM